MQIIDSNDFNLRTACYLLNRGEMEFVLIPVFHIGTQEFYDEVRTELDKCDQILFEGIGLKNLDALWWAYKKLASRLGLKYQNDVLKLSDFKDRLIHADFDEVRGMQEWKQIPLISRVFFKTLFPFGLLFLSFFETRMTFVKSFREKEDADDTFWFMRFGKTRSVKDFLGRKREELIFQEIDRITRQHKTGPLRIGIMYGAGHMGRVLEYLLEQQRFRISDSWFLTVCWLTSTRFRFKRNEGQNTK